MVLLLLMRPGFASSSPVSGEFFGVALILVPNGAPDAAKPWLGRFLPAVLRKRALARLGTSPIAVPAAAETGPQRSQRAADLGSPQLLRFLAGFAANHAACWQALHPPAPLPAHHVDLSQDRRSFGPAAQLSALAWLQFARVFAPMPKWVLPR